MSKSLNISPSALVTFFKCSQQFYWNYIEKLEPDEGSDNIYAVLGRSFHKVMELHDRYKLDYSELKKYWRGIFLTFLTETRYLPPNIEYERHLSRGYDLIKKAIKLKERWSSSNSIIANEKYIKLEYRNAVLDNVFLSGKIDLILKRDEIYTALDWKTASKAKEDAEDDFQLFVYIYFIHKVYNTPFENIFGALVYPSVEDIIFTQRKESDCKTLFDKLETMLRRIKASDFNREPKINKTEDKDCTFCPFIKRCSFGL